MKKLSKDRLLEDEAKIKFLHEALCRSIREMVAGETGVFLTIFIGGGVIDGLTVCTDDAGETCVAARMTEIDSDGETPCLERDIEDMGLDTLMTLYRHLLRKTERL